MAHKLQDQNQDGVGLLKKEKKKIKPPRMYRVIFLNDDFTPIEFVVNLIVHVFRKSYEEASRLTLEVHNKGSAIVGVYTREIAETKTTLASAIVIEHQHPLQVVMEPNE